MFHPPSLHHINTIVPSPPTGGDTGMGEHVNKNKRAFPVCTTCPKLPRCYFDRPRRPINISRLRCSVSIFAETSKSVYGRIEFLLTYLGLLSVCRISENEKNDYVTVIWKMMLLKQ